MVDVSSLLKNLKGRQQHIAIKLALEVLNNLNVKEVLMINFSETISDLIAFFGEGFLTNKEVFS